MLNLVIDTSEVQKESVCSSAGIQNLACIEIDLCLVAALSFVSFLALSFAYNGLLLLKLRKDPSLPTLFAWVRFFTSSRPSTSSGHAVNLLLSPCH